jgi:uncharacterized protein YaiL (DUF2058 family)
MSDTLRDQLLGLGFSAPKPAPRPELKPERKPERRAERKPAARRDTAPARKPRGAAPTSRADIDLAKAYAIRAQREKDERLAAERQKQDAARERREARARLAAMLEGRALNDAAADLARHFEYGGKIKRIHVNASQLRALNAGELGVLQVDGRYLLVDAATLAEAEAIFPAAIALKVDPGAPAEDDVPPDLVW